MRVRRWRLWLIPAVLLPVVLAGFIWLLPPALPFEFLVGAERATDKNDAYRARLDRRNGLERSLYNVHADWQPFIARARAELEQKGYKIVHARRESFITFYGPSSLTTGQEYVAVWNGLREVRPGIWEGNHVGWISVEVQSPAARGAYASVLRWLRGG